MSLNQDTARDIAAIGGCSRTHSRQHPSAARVLTPSRGSARMREVRGGGFVERNSAIRPILLLVAIAVSGDFLSLCGTIVGGGGGGARPAVSRGSFPPGAAAQSFTCPENAGVLKFWPREPGAGVQLARCQCNPGYFNTSNIFFQELLERVLKIRIVECTILSNCPCTLPLEPIDKNFL